MTSSSESRSRPRVPTSWYRRYSPRTVLLAVGLLALGDLGFYLAVVRPAALEEQERIARNAALVTRVQQARDRVEPVMAAAAKIDSADAEATALVEQIALPRRSAFSALLTELEAASAESGIEMRETSYAVEAIEGSENYGILAVNANFRGRYDGLVRLLYRLDRSDLFFIIGSLGATPRDEGRSSMLQINMRFDTFVRDL